MRPGTTRRSRPKILGPALNESLIGLLKDCLMSDLLCNNHNPYSIGPLILGLYVDLETSLYHSLDFGLTQDLKVDLDER